MYLKEYTHTFSDGDEKIFHAVVSPVEESNLSKVTIFMSQEYVETSRPFNYADIKGYEKIGYNEGYYINGLGDTVTSLDTFMEVYFSAIGGF